MAAALLVIGAACLIAGATVLLWPAGLMTAGLLLILGAIDLRR